MKIRLAVITNSISHFEVPLYRLCAMHPHLNFKVFYLRPIKSNRFDSEYGQEIHWGEDILSGYSSERNPTAKEMINSLNGWNADVVLMYGYSWPGALPIIIRNYLEGRPQILRGTLTHIADPRRTIKAKLLAPLKRVLLRLFQAYHYGGDYSQKALRNISVDEASMFFVPYSINTPTFISKSDNPKHMNAAQSLRVENGWSASDYVVLFIAYINWIKGPDIAMEAFRHVAQSNSRVKLMVVGSGRMLSDMQEYASRHQLLDSVKFMGFVPSAKTVPYYLASDLVICTSRFETWARMTNEAMLCERPCVVSHNVASSGGLVKNDQNGYVVATPNAANFSRAILSHFKKPREERLRMGRAARKAALHFSYENHIDNVVASARYALERCRKMDKDRSRA